MITNIPFQQLSISPKNVRQMTTTKAADNQLIASIRSQGVLQNLVVEPAGNDQFKVIAGGRRFAALGHLIKSEELDKDFLVPCLIKSDADEHTEISLAENTQREAMHPADRFVAYKALADQGYSEEDIAARFGVAIQSVRKLLALANVSPKLIDYFRKDKMSLECLVAFTVCPDYKKQLACYKDLSQRHLYPGAIRGWLLEESVSTASGIGAFVGKAAYLKAGGALSADLFENDTYLNDYPLVQQLAEQKLSRQANKIKKLEAWSWVEISLSGVSAADDLVRLRPQLTDVPKTVSDHIAQLTEKAETLEQQCITQDWPEELEQAFEAAEKALDEAIESRDQEYLRFDDEQMGYSGCIVTFDHQGKLSILRGLACKKDVQRQQRQTQSTETTDKPASTYSQSLLNDLAAYRQQITKACLLKRPEVALDVLHYSLCVQMLSGRYHQGRHLVDATFNEVVSISSRNDLEGTTADKSMANFHKKLPLAWLDEDDDGKRLAAFMALSASEKKRLIAYCVTTTLTIGNRGTYADQDYLVDHLQIDFVQHWRPTSDNFLSRLDKALLLTTFTPCRGENWAKQHTADKKSTVVENMANWFEEKSDQDDDPRCSWLPETF